MSLPRQVPGHRREFMTETYVVRAGEHIDLDRLQSIYCEANDGDKCVLEYRGEISGPARAFSYDDLMDLIHHGQSGDLEMSNFCANRCPIDCVPVVDRSASIRAIYDVYVTQYNIVCRLDSGDWCLLYHR